jgi:hypothetical protein
MPSFRPSRDFLGGFFHPHRRNQMTERLDPAEIVGMLGRVSIDEIVSIMFQDLPDLGALIDRAVDEAIDKA